MSTSGALDITRWANTRFQLNPEMDAEANEYRVSGSVAFADVRNRSCPKKKSFQTTMTINTAPANRTGRRSGSRIEKKVRNLEAPSIAAASSRSVGRLRTNPVVKNTTSPIRVPIIMSA